MGSLLRRSGRFYRRSDAKPVVAVRPEAQAQAAVAHVVLTGFEQVLDAGGADVELDLHLVAGEVVDGDHGAAVPLAAVGEDLGRLVLEQRAGPPAELGR